MRSKFKWTLVLFMALIVQVSFAQEKTLTGVVTESGMPLPGATVIVKGTQHGTQTDLEGHYTLKVNPGDVLVFSFIGLKDVNYTVGTANSYNASLVADDAMLEEVIVTALGIKRDKKKLGYSSQVVSGEELSDAGQTNAISALSGNVAGLQITTPSSMGGSTRIVLRGIGSVMGENRPLIIVDGVPLDNSNFANTGMQRGVGGRDYGDAAADIDPRDIESVTVLKGGPASALYGARAGNGAILYTTKSAKTGRTDIEFNTGVTLESINIMPKLQNLYGGGSGPEFNTINVGGREYNIAEYDVDESWGPKFDGTPYLPWYAFDPEFSNDYMKEVPWEASKNDVKSFFRMGVTRNNSVSFSKSFTNSNIRMSFGNTATDGIQPNSKLNRNNFSVNAMSQLSDKLKVEASVSYINTKASGRPELGYGDNSVSQKFFQWSQRQLDFNKLKDYKLASGDQRSWNRSAWDDATPAYSDNPYWTVYENTSDDQRVRMYGNGKVTYNFTPNLYAVGNVYGDNYSLTVQERVAVGSQAQSSYTLTKRNISEFNYEGRLHFDKNFNRFGLNTFVGANRSERRREVLLGRSVGGLILRDVYNLSNSANTPTAENSFSHERVNSLYGSLTLNFDEMLYLEGTTRTDWFSTVKSSSTYNSLTGTFIFSKLLPSVEWLDFGKIRGGWAEVGNGTEPYRTLDYIVSNNPFNGDPRYTEDLRANNADLKTELMTTKEIGLEAAMFRSRLSFELSLYQTITDDLITPLEVDPATGFTSRVINAGRLKNEGFEATVNIVPVRTENFSWDLTWNYAKNNNVLEELYDGVNSLELTRAPFNVRLMAIKGMKYGQIMGTDYERDAKGNRIIDSNGLYKATADLRPLGSVLADYNMGIGNSFRYKNFRLNVLFDIQKGGVYYSTTHMFGMYSGMLEESAANGIRENGLVLEGVKEDGSINDTNVDAIEWAKAHQTSVDAQNVFDASYIKLRNVSLSYDLPKNWVGPFSGVTVSMYGQNLFTWGLDWDGMDPEMASYGSGNIQAIEGASLPSTRTYGMNVKFKF